MNIVILAQIEFPTTIGGAGRYVQLLAEGMAASGHRVTVVALGPSGQDSVSERIRVIRCGPMRRWWQVPATLRAVRRACGQRAAQGRIDLVSVHQPLMALGLLADARAKRVPWVYHFHSPWAQETRIWRRVPWWDPIGRCDLWLRWWIEHVVVRHARRCVTLSESMKATLVRLHRVPADRVSVVPGCVDLARFAPVDSTAAVRAGLELPPDRAVVLTVRSLVPRMNLDGLIRAMRLVVRQRPEALLCIGGSGELAGSLQVLIGALRLQDHVRLLGRIPEEQLPRWYQAADLFVVPSKALEGFGLATLEALACGTPVVGTPVGGTPELLAGLDASLLCESITPEAMASAILRTLDRLREAQARRELHLQCRAFAERFSQRAMIDAVEQVYRDAARLKVLHVHTLPVISGSGLIVLLCMEGQRAAGYDVELACAPGGPLLDRAEQAGMAVRPIRHLVQPVSPIADLLAVLELWRLIRRHRYTIVHTHNSKAGFLGRLAARLAGTPVIVHTVHGFSFHAQEPWWRRVLFKQLERLAARWCDHLIMISEPLIAWALQERIAPRARMTKIYDGIDLAAFRQPVDPTSLRALRDELGFHGQEFIVGEVAKLWPGKGHDVLFHAVALLRDRLPSLRLLVVGEGELRPALVQLARELGIADRVVFTGFRSDIPLLTQVLDVAILPSLFEGMGRVVLEAQAAGKPVIASRVGGLPDLIQDGVNGLLVEPRNAEQLAAALQRLAEQPELRRQLGEAAQRMLDPRFDAGTVVEQILELYATLLRAPS